MKFVRSTMASSMNCSRNAAPKSKRKYSFTFGSRPCNRAKYAHSAQKANSPLRGRTPFSPAALTSPPDNISRFRTVSHSKFESPFRNFIDPILHVYLPLHFLPAVAPRARQQFSFQTLPSDRSPHQKAISLSSSLVLSVLSTAKPPSLWPCSSLQTTSPTETLRPSSI